MIAAASLILIEAVVRTIRIFFLILVIIYYRIGVILEVYSGPFTGGKVCCGEKKFY